ncbi:MAG: hypothetical protein P4M14_13225 [Gammaproteobacteria bacterium]|nr:hypothetical protein [Gammaproteobacteria bacterium]
MDFKSLLKLSLISAFLCISNMSAATQAPAIVCDQTYALCTSAACIPDPNNSERTICDCAVMKGKSAGFTTCAQRKPFVDKYKAEHLISTFSFEQFAAKKSLTCPQGAPWSNCVDMPCTQDSQHPNHAICSCTVNNTQAFFTFGGECINSTCESGFWSGATQGTASDALRDALDIVEKNPAMPIACPANINNH